MEKHETGSFQHDKGVHKNITTQQKEKREKRRKRSDGND